MNIFQRQKSTLASLLSTIPKVTLKLLLSNNLIGKLINCLNDQQDQVIVESLGALRLVMSLSFTTTINYLTYNNSSTTEI